MPAGLQTWNAAGQPILEITDRIARVLGIATLTGGTDGSLTNTGFATGTGFAACIPVANGAAPVPLVTITGNVLAWDFTPGVGYVGTYKLVYGVY